MRLADAFPSLGGELGQLPVVLDANEVAALTGLSRWKIYEACRAGELPEGLEPIRVGRRLLWPTARVLAALGLIVPPLVAGGGAFDLHTLDGDGSPESAPGLSARVFPLIRGTASEAQ